MTLRPHFPQEPSLLPKGARASKNTPDPPITPFPTRVVASQHRPRTCTEDNEMNGKMGLPGPFPFSPSFRTPPSVQGSVGGVCAH